MVNIGSALEARQLGSVLKALGNRGILTFKGMYWIRFADVQKNMIPSVGKKKEKKKKHIKELTKKIK